MNFGIIIIYTYCGKNALYIMASGFYDVLMFVEASKQRVLCSAETSC